MLYLSQQKLVKSCRLKYFLHFIADMKQLELALVYQGFIHHQQDAQPGRGYIGHILNVNLNRVNLFGHLLKLLQQLRRCDRIHSPLDHGAEFSISK